MESDPESVSDGCTPIKAHHETISAEVVEWSEQLRSVISVWLGAAAVEFESDSAPAGEK